MDRLTAFLILLLFILPAAWAGADMPVDLRKFLIQRLHLDQNQIKQIEMGQSVAIEIPTEKREEVALFGLIRIETTPEHFVSKFRDLVEFEAFNGVLQNGKFSSPPQLSDVVRLKWEADDLQEISECKRDDCGVRLPSGSVTDLRASVDWSSADARVRANELLQAKIVDFVRSYQRQGDDVLPVYTKDGRSIRVKDGLHVLLQNSEYIRLHVPQLLSYLRNFPNEKNPNAEDLFYWQKATFGLQPVIRVSHVIILKLDEIPTMSYAIASKMLYANHYFRDALEVRLLMRDPKGCDPCGFYLLALNRSHVDGMTGFKGWLIRRSSVKKSIEKLDQWLATIKIRLETDLPARDATR